MKKNTLLPLLLLLIGMAYGQEETAQWYFGINAGLQFNNDGSVTALTDGKLRTEEGCASIADENGNLLFYTDGITVYNGDHDVMANGTGLYGDPSSTQSAIIVPGPKSDSIFYVFTVDTSIQEGDPDNGFNYSIIDISQNGGKGAVIRKNINLLPDCSEKLAAVGKNCAEESFWVVTLATSNGNEGAANTFHAFGVSEQGVDETSVKSSFTKQFLDPRGYLKFSSDGRKLASANELDGLFLYDFDSENGRVSNPREIAISAPNKNPYGLEFSPNNRYLYVHAHLGGPPLGDFHRSNLLQYDLDNENINASETVLHQGNNYRGALQLGANGRIYLTITENYVRGTSYLGVIHNPDRGGTASAYEHKAIFLGGGLAMQGLPPFLQSFFSRTGLLANSDGSSSNAGTICLGDDLVLETDPLNGASYHWTYNGIPFDNPTGHSLEIENVDESNAGQYRVVITPPDAVDCEIIGEANIQINRPPLANRAVLEQCDVDENGEDGYTLFNLNQISAELSEDSENRVTFYETLTDLADENPILEPGRFRNTVSREQTLHVVITDIFGCTNETELLLQVNASPGELVTSEVLYACGTGDGEALKGSFDLETFVNETYTGYGTGLYGNKEDALLETNPISQSNAYISETNTLFVRLETMNQCLGIEKLQLVVSPTPVAVIESEYKVCTNSPDLLLAAEAGFDTYGWFRTENGSETQLSAERTLPVLLPGNYRLEVGRNYADGEVLCTGSATFRVIPSNSATIVDIPATDLLENNRVEIMVTGDGDYEYSLGSPDGPFQDTPIFENVSPGLLTVYVRDRNGCGIAQDEVSVIGFPRYFTPNGDGINESWNLIGVSRGRSVIVSIFDRYGTLLHELDATDENGWNGTFNGRLLPASDYWFKIQLEGGRTHKGHFSLKR
ncbi:MAG: T9SS type B sorting domain-containing protein [Bacteroidota bacterium]